ncbi:hypothetical protein SUDANB121_00889 [Nocardiopsis dassonvillei]
MPGRREPTDAGWALPAPLMPADPRKGEEWADHRKIINAVLSRTRTGIPWRDPPERHGPWETAAGRHRRWCNDGTWPRIADRLRIDAASGEELIAGVDPTTVRAPQHAAGEAKKGTGSGGRRAGPKHSAAPGAGRPPRSTCSPIGTGARWRRPRPRASAGTAWCSSR